MNSKCLKAYIGAMLCAMLLYPALADADQQCYFDLYVNQAFGQSPTEGPYSSLTQCEAAQNEIRNTDPSDEMSGCTCSGSAASAYSGGSSMQQIIQQQTLHNWQMLFQQLFNGNQKDEQEQQLKNEQAEAWERQQTIKKQQEKQAEYQKLCGELQGDVCASGPDLQLKGVDDSDQGNLQLKTGNDFFGTNSSPRGSLTDCKPAASSPASSAMQELQNAAAESQAAAQANSPECAKAEAAGAFADSPGESNTLKPSFGGGGYRLTSAQSKQANVLLIQIQKLSTAMTTDQNNYNAAEQKKRDADQAVQKAQQQLAALQAEPSDPNSGSTATVDPNLAAAEKLLAQAQQNDQQASTSLQKAQQNLNQDQSEFSKLQTQQKQFISSVRSDSGGSSGGP